MLYLRSSLFLLLFSLVTAGYGTLILGIGRWASQRSVARLGRSWGRVVLWLLARICGLHYRIEGLEHLPRSRAVLLSNHQSTWETIALRALLPFEQSWVLKEELLRVPFYGWALRRLDSIAIDRSAGMQAIRKLMTQGKAHLARGQVVVVFPEGTRVALGVETRFSLGGAMLAAQAQVPIVPVAHNAGVFWSRTSWLKRPGCIDVRIGAPIASAGRSAQQINAAAEQWIRGAQALMAMTPGPLPTGGG